MNSLPTDQANNAPILSVVCEEPEGTVTRHVYPLIFTPENIDKFWNKAKKHRTLYGKEIPNLTEFMNLFFWDHPKGREYGIMANGLFWVVDDFEAVFYITDIRKFEDCLVHYTFFSGRHKGREKLVKEMLHYLFEVYQFNRLSAEIPCYAVPQARKFAQALGFIYEGKRRACATYKGEKFDVNLYGLLRSEFLNGIA